MEKIVLEVYEALAKAWWGASSEKRKEINKRMSVRIGKELFSYSKEDFQQYLNDLRNKMTERGLTQETLDSILNEAD